MTTRLPRRREVLVGLGACALPGCGGASPPPSGSAVPTVPPSRGGTDRLGEPAPAWDVPWVGGHGPSLADLRGRVVLLRFWTDTCPFCRATAPALAQLHETFADRGVTVIGMYHPKPRGTERTAEQVAEVATAYGFRFPVGLDNSWTVLDAYWLSHGDREYTSVSFIIDRDGIIRFVHPGPEFHPDGPADHQACRTDFADITRALEALTA